MAYTYTVQYDALGRAYMDQPGPRTYISPVAFGKDAPTDTTSIFRHAPRFNPKTGDWETPMDWGNIANIGAATGLTLGAANAGMFGGGAAGFLGGGHAAVGPTASALDTVGYGTGAAYGGAGAELGFGAGSGVTGAASGGSQYIADAVRRTAEQAAGKGTGMALTPLTELLAKYGFQAGTQLGGALIQSKAQMDAARIQQEYNDKALAAALEEQAYERKRAEEQTAYDRLHGEENTAYTRQRAAELLGYNKEQFGNYLSNLSPYRQAGTSALSRLQAALAGSPWQPNNGVMRSFG
jgi:hypothetical protein